MESPSASVAAKADIRTTISSKTCDIGHFSWTNPTPLHHQGSQSIACVGSKHWNSWGRMTHQWGADCWESARFLPPQWQGRNKRGFFHDGAHQLANASDNSFPDTPRVRASRDVECRPFSVVLSYDISVSSLDTIVELTFSSFEVCTIVTKHEFRRSPPAGKSSERLNESTCFPNASNNSGNLFCVEKQLDYYRYGW